MPFSAGTLKTAKALPHGVAFAALAKVAEMVCVRFVEWMPSFTHELQRFASSLGVNDLGKRKPCRNSLNDGIGFNASNLSQFCSNVFFPSDNNLARNSLVELLLTASSPSAVARRISLVVVDSIQKIAIRPWPHVGNKERIRIPAFAHPNASPAVIFPLLEVWIGTAVSHAPPHMVEGRNHFEWHTRKYMPI